MAMSTAPFEIVQAAHALSALGLVTAFGHVSSRSGDGFLITPGVDLATVTEADVVEVSLTATSLPPGAPAEAWLHRALYLARPDVAAIARAMPPRAFAVSARTGELTLSHGQAAWLGASVPVHDDARLLRTPELAQAAAASLPAGEALLLRGNGAVTVGSAPGIAVTRMWLLAAACDTWLDGESSAVTALRADEIESWRAVQDELLPRLWQHLSRRVDSPAGPAVGGPGGLPE
jgi:HCOMODA/2-hydroxy-3-carboxy-muconic semialdehyde decarboxylase